MGHNLPTRLLCPWGFPGKNTGVGCHFLLKGIFLTQGSNPHRLPSQAGSLPLSHLGSPWTGIHDYYFLLGARKFLTPLIIFFPLKASEVKVKGKESESSSVAICKAHLPLIMAGVEVVCSSVKWTPWSTQSLILAALPSILAVYRLAD